MAEQLTPQQRQAVENRGGRLLVSAAAGSGKTKVLVDRLMSYLTDPVTPANIDDFLLITYTKAAAGELRGKIAAKLTQRVAQEPENVHLRKQLQRLYLTKISTVHSFCGDVLREYAYELNLPGDFRVADENECSELRIWVMEKLLDQSYEARMDDPAFRAFVDSQGLGRDDRQVPQIVFQVYDSARCHLHPHRWLDSCLQMTDTDDLTDAGQTVYGKYLMERLFAWLDLQIQALENCCRQCGQTDGFQKPGALLEDTVFQLRRLRQAESWDQVAQWRNVDFGRLVFPKACTDEELKSGIKAVREVCKKGLEKRTQPFSDLSGQVLADLSASALATRGLIALVKEFEQAYDRAKQSRRILDFSDLEHKMLDLLLGKGRTAPTAAAREVGNRFREVMVDEYQDSNAVQDAIYNALTGARNNLFLVGDVKQSIYQFRLADPGIFLEKYHSFCPAQEAQPGQDRKVILSRNFRSSAGVLEGCNDVFRLCMSPQVGGMDYGEAEALYEGLPHVSLGEPDVELHCLPVEKETYPEEAAYVAGQIAALLKTGTVRQGDQLRPVRPEDIVILLRSPGSSGIYYQRALEKRGIRYATGGGVDLFQTQEIGTLYALLQTVHNPRLDIPLAATMLSPVFAFTADDLAALRAGRKGCALIDAVRQDDREKSRAFLQTMDCLRNAMGHRSLTGLLEMILVETGLEEIYAAMDDGQAKVANIQLFYQLAVEFEAGGNRDLGRFLEHLQTMEDRGLITTGEQSAAGCVTIMSIHKSKGLEFPVVFLCGLGREFNMESQRGAVLCHKQMGLGLSAVDEENRLRYPTVAKRAIAGIIGQEAVSEEMRVLYVAMTRARDRLIMTYASNRLEKELAELVQRLNMGGLPLLTREAMCPGQWVLLTALHKPEAGALFALGGRPTELLSGARPWKIRVETAPETGATTLVGEETATDISAEQLETIRRGLQFRYAHQAAVNTPSKLTATGMKGRYQDQEVAEQATIQVSERTWRKPSFAESRMDGRDYGNAIHAVMQYIDFATCTSWEAVAAEIQRLQDQGYLSRRQGELVRPQVIYAFFATELGQKLRQGTVLREFKFSLLSDGEEYDPQLRGEQVLLQGVVDCALVEADGITIIDFKTDYVTQETLEQKVARYAPQVHAYARAMSRIYELPVKKSVLYFFHLGKIVQV